MSEHPSAAFRLPFSAFFRTCSISLALSALLLATAGCWSEVEFEPDQEPVAEQSTPETPPAAGASPETAPASPTEPGTAEPAAVESATPTTDSGTEPAEKKLTFEELFGNDETQESASPPADAPSLVEETTVPLAEERAPVTEEQPREFMPWEQDTASQPPAPPAVGDRYATSPATTDPLPPTEEAFSEPAPEVPTVSEEQPNESLPGENPPELTSVKSLPADLQPAESEPAAVTPIEPVPTEELATITPPSVDESLAGIASLLPEADESEPASTAQLDPSNTRHMAWLLGSKWSLMVLSQHAGAPADEQAQMLKENELLAQTLDVELPRTSTYSASLPTAAFLESMLAAGRELGTVIGAKHSAEDTALLEAAMKSNLVLVLRETRADLIPAVVRSVTAAAERAQLPSDLVQPFTSALSGSPTPEQVDQAVFDFHRAVEEYLRAQ